MTRAIRIGVQLALLTLLAPPASAAVITLDCDWQASDGDPTKPGYRHQFTFDTDRLKEGATSAWTACGPKGCKKALEWRSENLRFVSASPQKIVFENDGISDTIDRATLKVVSVSKKYGLLGTHTCQLGESALPKPQF